MSVCEDMHVTVDSARTSPCVCNSIGGFPMGEATLSSTSLSLAAPPSLPPSVSLGAPSLSLGVPWAAFSCCQHLPLSLSLSPSTTLSLPLSLPLPPCQPRYACASAWPGCQKMVQRKARRARGKGEHLAVLCNTARTWRKARCAQLDSFFLPASAPGMHECVSMTPCTQVLSASLSHSASLPPTASGAQRSTFDGRGLRAPRSTSASGRVRGAFSARCFFLWRLPEDSSALVHALQQLLTDRQPLQVLYGFHVRLLQRL